MSAFTSQTPQTPAASEFSAGVTATLRRWTALRAAIEGEWGGGSCLSKAEQIRTHILSMFLSSSTLKYDAQDVEDFLYISMEEQFCCQLEDGSPSDVGGIIFDMAVKCLEGDFTLSRQMVEFAEKEREVLEAKMNVNVLVEGEDFEEDMEEEDEMDNITTTTTTTSSQNVMNASSSDMQSFANQSLFGAAPVQQHLPPPRQLGEEEVVVEKEKIVDEDGFEQVVRRSKRKNKGVKGNP